MASNEVLDRSRRAACFGSSCLTELLASLADKRQNEASLRVGVVGKHSLFPVLVTNQYTTAKTYMAINPILIKLHFVFL